MLSDRPLPVSEYKYIDEKGDDGFTKRMERLDQGVTKIFNIVYPRFPVPDFNSLSFAQVESITHAILMIERGDAGSTVLFGYKHILSVLVEAPDNQKDGYFYTQILTSKYEFIEEPASDLFNLLSPLELEEVIELLRYNFPNHVKAISKFPSPEYKND
jgi:hypothetical protein